MVMNNSNIQSIEWILEKMEELTKKVMYNSSPNETYMIEYIGEFRGLLNLLANSGYESYGLKFKVILPTDEEYEKSLPNEDENNG